MSMGRTGGTRSKISGLEDHLGFWLRFVSNYVSQAFAGRLLAAGVSTAEWVVLREMHERAEESPSVLASRMGFTRGGVSKIVDRLVAKGLATRQGRDDDRRFQSVALTKAGRALVPVLAALADENDEEAFRVLTADEREQLRRILVKLVREHNLRRIPTE